MTRAVLLPMGGDPFLDAYWFRHYGTWADQVDELRVIVCDQPDPEIQAYIKGQADALPNAAVRFQPRTDHGEMIRILLEETDADIVMLCEDDAFVRFPAIIGRAFSEIESGEVDVIGCPRSTGSDGILSWAKAKYGDWVTESGESGPILWPCFLFAKREDLIRTDRRFGAWGWKPEEDILGQTFPTEEALDTFGWATLQLREIGLRIRAVSNYRAQLWRLADWAGEAPWFHIGGLSVGHGLHLLGGESADRAAQWEAMRGDQHDWQKRISWWQRVLEKWDGALPEYHAAYRLALGELMVGAGIDREGVAAWRSGFDSLITWAE